MFKKILIANRGEIAVRIIRACRSLGIASVAVYEALDSSSLHVRLADESHLLTSPLGLNDQEALLQVAQRSGANAIHPGYGFLAENAAFAFACQQAGLTFIGPPPEVLNLLRHKIDTMQRVRSAGFPVVQHSEVFFADYDEEMIRQAVTHEVEGLGLPVIVKSFRGGRGRGAHLVSRIERLDGLVRRAQAESMAVYGDSRVYLEKAIFPSHMVGVQILADRFGNLIHLGEREGSLIHGNQKLLEESPALCLNDEQRAELYQAATAIARLLRLQNAGSVEFIIDQAGRFFFTELKGRIQTDHTLTEARSQVDLVAEQIRLAAGEPLRMRQEDVRLSGHAIHCRVSAEDPQRGYLPSPGAVLHLRLPGGPSVRVDTYLSAGCEIPATYDSLIAKLTVWAPERATCIARLRTALDEFMVVGPASNQALLQHVSRLPAFVDGQYNTSLAVVPGTHAGGVGEPLSEQGTHAARDLAVITALAYLRQDQGAAQPTQPERLSSGWHRSSRRLPE